MTQHGNGFAPATRHQAHARLAFAGPAKSGKTFSALRVAQYLGDRIALIDTERGSASKYVGEPEIPDFDVLELESFSPDDYISAISMAGQARYPVLIIDSISHAWMGTGGVLEIVDTATSRSLSKNAYTSGWREATPMHNKLVEAMLHYPGHLIVTVRTKSRYVMETDRNGKQLPKKVGMEWVQREGMEYEFDVVGELDNEHTMVIHETRCRALDGKIFAKPGEDLAQPLIDWLSIGAPAILKPVVQLKAAHGEIHLEHPTFNEVNSLVELARSCGVDLVTFGHDVRRLMHLPDDTPITKKFLREQMVMAQYEVCEQHYREVLSTQGNGGDHGTDDDDVPLTPGPAAPNEPVAQLSHQGEGGESSDTSETLLEVASADAEGIPDDILDASDPPEVEVGPDGWVVAAGWAMLQARAAKHDKVPLIAKIQRDDAGLTRGSFRYAWVEVGPKTAKVKL